MSPGLVEAAGVPPDPPQPKGDPIPSPPTSGGDTRPGTPYLHGAERVPGAGVRGAVGS